MGKETIGKLMIEEASQREIEPQKRHNNYVS